MDDHKVLRWARAAWARRVFSWRPPRLRRLLRRRQTKPHRPQSHWGHRANRALSGVASLTLILVLARQLAGITWALVPGAASDAPAPVINAATLPAPPQSPVAHIQRIVDADLFGEHVEQPAGPAVQPLEAPETQLDLSLSATVSGARAEGFGVAVIANGGVERTYSVNEEIEGAGGAVLRAIHADRVILDVAGRFQTLRLPRSEPADNSLGFTAAAPNPFAPLGAAASPSSPETAPSGDALRLSRIAHAVPHVEQGTMVGFRLNPRGGPAPFEALGFEPGDVVTEINGAALREPGQAPEVFERLAESSQANLVLIRDGSPRVLTVDTSVVQAAGNVP